MDWCASKLFKRGPVELEAESDAQRDITTNQQAHFTFGKSVPSLSLNRRVPNMKSWTLFTCQHPMQNFLCLIFVQNLSVCSGEQNFALLHNIDQTTFCTILISISTIFTKAHFAQYCPGRLYPSTLSILYMMICRKESMPTAVGNMWMKIIQCTSWINIDPPHILCILVPSPSIVQCGECIHCICYIYCKFYQYVLW